MEIRESSASRIFGEDKFSRRMGLMEEEEDLRREELIRKRKM